MPAPEIIGRTKSNPYFRRAIASPEFEAVVEERELLLRRLTTLPAVEATEWPTVVNDQTLAAWEEAVVAEDAQTRARAVKHGRLTARLDALAGHFGSLAVDYARLCQSLDSDLHELMATVDEHVARLDGARSPDEIIAAGGDAVSAYNELRSLRTSYDLLREAQKWSTPSHMWVSSASRYFYDDPLASNLAIRNLDEIFPCWRDGRTSTVVISGDEPDPRPWPKDPVAQLIWLSTSAAEVWVPTEAQLNQLHAERRARRNAAAARETGRSAQQTPTSEYPKQTTRHPGTYRRAVPIENVG
ncbi:hypothetical protein [Mycobacterium sp. ITM-2016-00318]|uniref:hypothetical protein n=1 Tax=Mycobacterium sp. ITM-2016-00318 TaxID=2099693 RepID=UPI001159860D|nr:hypothetical protein [Mycobacterium sp. ITM-2016-00318]WNG94997.1 hypothetical protein C6A82_011495 [Mycobacterium sp. ITM-2016-00318]